MYKNENSSYNIAQKLKESWWGLLGVLILLIGLLGLIKNIPIIDILWYILGWYGYLLILDSIIYIIQGHSFISDRKIELIEMFFWSVPFWFIFEAYNLVLKNWYYVFAFKSNLIMGIFAFFAFATVLPASFFHYELVKALNIFTKSQISPKAFKIWKPICKYFGALCIVLPLVIPDYTFWMVWGAALGIPAIINYNIGAPSLLRDLKNGTITRVYRLLSGGVIAGIVWEALNFWARCKWIYTVPGLEDVKLFEMPILGFLGFPVLALNSFSLYSLFSYLLRGKRNWEIKDKNQHKESRSKGYIPAIVISIVFSILVYIGLININLKSRRPELNEIPSLCENRIEKLKEVGIYTPQQLYSRVKKEGMNTVERKTKIKKENLEKAKDFCSLLLHKGMGYKNAILLNRLGINRVDQLKGKSAEEILQEMKQVEKIGEYPRLKEIRVWIRAVEIFGRTKR